MFISFLQQINSFNEHCMDFIINCIQFLHIPEFLLEAVAESITLIPFLFVIFVFIEIFENYFAEKIEKISLSSKAWGPFIGSCLAIIPQCGFSVIATMLYLKRFITLGTLIAVYLATSDEAIPILLVYPEHFGVIKNVIFAKILIGVFAGYIIDFIFKTQLNNEPKVVEVCECGCCNNEIKTPVTNLFLHPVKHTLNIFLFILIINCLLSWAFSYANESLNSIFNVNQFIQVILISIIGLIPNCASSVLIVMLFLKNVIGFGSLIAGLSTNAGLGLLVLFKNNSSIKESLKIVLIVFLIAVLLGLFLQMA